MPTTCLQYYQLNAITYCEYQRFFSGTMHMLLLSLSVHGGHHMLIMSTINSTYVTHYVIFIESTINWTVFYAQAKI